MSLFASCWECRLKCVGAHPPRTGASFIQIVWKMGRHIEEDDDESLLGNDWDQAALSNPNCLYQSSSTHAFPR